jgi:hypothetical protein
MTWTKTTAFSSKPEQNQNASYDKDSGDRPIQAEADTEANLLLGVTSEEKRLLVRILYGFPYIGILHRSHHTRDTPSLCLPRIDSPNHPWTLEEISQSRRQQLDRSNNGWPFG